MDAWHMSSQGSERRAAPRLAVTYRLDVQAPAGNGGCVLDLSMSGMRVRFRSELDLAGTERMSIVFPRWLELGPGIEVTGRFAWLRPTRDGSTEAGFAFDRLSQRDTSLIQVLIQRLAEALAEDRPSVPAS
jgi:hypothetical protein